MCRFTGLTQTTQNPQMISSGCSFVISARDVKAAPEAALEVLVEKSETSTPR